jgi:glycosyltransferase involved in cell wall biosynthesis
LDSEKTNHTRSNILACIPAYDEEETIAKILLKTFEHVDVILVCDDGSKDLTGAIAERMGATVIKHDSNLGYGASLKSLFKKALMLDFDFLVTLDADGQHGPEQIPQLVNGLRNGFDIVIGSRFLDESSSNIPKWRKQGIDIITNMLPNNQPKITDSQSGFRAYKRGVIESISLTETGMGASAEILLKTLSKGFNIKEVPINVSYDERSHSQNPLIHGFLVVLSIVKHLSIRHPLLSYGLVGSIVLIISGYFWAWNLKIFAETNGFNTNLVLIAMAGTVVGLILMTTSMILWVIVSLILEERDLRVQ